MTTVYSTEDIQRIKSNAFNRAYQRSEFYSKIENQEVFSEEFMGIAHMFYDLAEGNIASLNRVSVHELGKFLYSLDKMKRSGFVLDENIVRAAVDIAIDKGIEGVRVFQYSTTILRNWLLEDREQ